MLKLLKYSAIVIVCSNAMVLLSGCSSSQGNKLRAYFGDMNGNDKVYVLPRKKLKNPKKIDITRLPAPEYDTVPYPAYIIKNSSDDNLSSPPEEYSVPSSSAPIGVLGEKEAHRKLRLAGSEDAKPSKKSLFH